jgi:hypothetical protein
MDYVRIRQIKLMVVVVMCISYNYIDGILYKPIYKYIYKDSKEKRKEINSMINKMEPKTRFVS